MQKTILMIVAVALVGCASTPKVIPNSPLAAAALNAAIRESLKKPTGELTKADLEKVTYLSLADKKLTEVPNGLAKLSQLTDLRLSRNKLTDVKGLEKLDQLTKLYLPDNQLTDVKGLENLTQLSTLSLFNNQLTNVKGLENLTQLTRLELGGNPLIDVTGLEKLMQLEVLALMRNQLTDVTGLEKFTQLRVLWLNDNPDLTKAQIDQLQKALPKCTIRNNAKK